MNKKWVGKSQAGQMAVEMVLIMILLLSIATAVRNMLSENEAFINLTQRPWQTLAGMMTSGVWKPAEEAIVKHPNQYNRQWTVKGEVVD